ncbi:type-2 ice-structuring protein [Oryzias melastigma]|uniref:type-2 ice-structuring protein n=1 Tax=Oryzias melastigma TaxID=30732 RepID=UPI000CF82329|nr:type-2 ice-structuring protein [Oryzias melastigma]
MVSIMGMLAVCVLVCAVMVQIKAAAVQDADVKKSEATSELVKRSEGCGINWSQINNRCFRYIPEAKTWAHAEKSCMSIGGNLASVHSIDEYHKIQELIKTTTHEYTKAWVGGSDAQESNVWLWSDGSSFHYTDWCSGQPNYFLVSQHCIQINYSSEKCWDNLGCNDHRTFVCVKKM